MILETRQYDANSLLERLPHRYENVLLDQVNYQRSPTEISGDLRLQINTKTDPRAIFLQEISPGQHAIIPSALMEILALASVACTDYESGSLIIFASMSHFEVLGVAPANEPILGSVIKLKDKGNFLRCKGELRTQSGDRIASGELMAFIVQSGLLSADPSVPTKQVEIPSLNIDIPTLKSRFKKADAMVVCDRIRRIDLETGIIVGEYIYPESHPFTRGHFPGNPIMMGIMQLLGLEDTLNAAIQHHALPVGHWTCDADLVRSDGALIAEVKGAAFKPNSPISITTCKTKKMVFRDPVRPLDRIYVVIRNLQTT